MADIEYVFPASAGVILGDYFDDFLDVGLSRVSGGDPIGGVWLDGGIASFPRQRG